MKLENSFAVTGPPEAAWDLLMDVPRVIPCMPGAELVETIDDDNWKARMRVKLGPISLSFLTDVRREEVDEEARRVRLKTSGREERGRGAANATIESSLSSDDGGRTTVTTVTDLALSGPAAQYGRGLVQSVAEQLLKSFAECLEQQLAPQAESGDTVEATAGEQPQQQAQPRQGQPPQAKPVSAVKLAGGVARSFLGGLVKRAAPVLKRIARRG